MASLEALALANTKHAESVCSTESGTNGTLVSLRALRKFGVLCGFTAELAEKPQWTRRKARANLDFRVGARPQCKALRYESENFCDSLLKRFSCFLFDALQQLFFSQYL